MKRFQAFLASKFNIAEKDKVIDLPIEELTPNPFQPRKDFSNDDLEPLAESIAEYGIIQPIIVKEREEVPYMTINGECVSGARYEIIAGERRWRAAQMLFMKTVPCVIVEADGKRSAQLAYIENVQRKDLNFFEEAFAIHSLIVVMGLTQSQAAEKFQLSQSAVANKLKLLKFTKNEQELIIRYGLTERHARSIMRVDDLDSRLRIIQKVHAACMNASECEKYINKFLGGGEPRPPKPIENPNTKRCRKIGMISDVRFFLNSVNRAVGIVTEAGINVERQETDMGDYIEMILKIPKRNGE